MESSLEPAPVHDGAHLERPDALAREHFTISDLTAEFDVTARALRFYEDEGLIAPARQGLTRIYSKRDRARLAWIMRAKNVGFREQVERMQQQRSDIDSAIAELTQFIAVIENLDNAAKA
jgi:DNA-binding transcriptional MerR regulator